jgi:hypothetical protein
MTLDQTIQFLEGRKTENIEDRLETGERIVTDGGHNIDQKTTVDRTRRHFLTATAAGIAGIAGCQERNQTQGNGNGNSGTGGGTNTSTNQNQSSTETPEPDFPRRIDINEAPSIGESYDPSSLLPSDAQQQRNQVPVKRIQDDYPDRTEQIKETLQRSTGNFDNWLKNARTGVATLWELDWANHNNMMPDIVTTASGGIGPSIEITYQNNNQETQTDLVYIRAQDNQQYLKERYQENAPQSKWHNGNPGNEHFVDWGIWEDLDLTKHDYDEELLQNGRETFSNLIPGVNSDSYARFDGYEGEVEKGVMDDDYLRELSHAFEAEQSKYMEMKQNLARAAEMTEGENALGVHINENGQKIFEELTPEQYKEVSPYFYHWKSRDVLD